MKKILIALMMALVVALGFTAGASTLTAAPDSNPVVKALAPAPAAAAWGTSVSHASDDSGYTGDIHIICVNGNHDYLAPGEATFFQSSGNPGCPLSGVQKIVVAYNQTVYCKNAAPPYNNTYYYTGTNQMPSNATYKCYSQRPL